MRALACAVVLLGLTGIVSAAPDVPTPPRPRLLLDSAVRTAWQAQAKQPGSTVARAATRCGEVRTNAKDHTRDLYMGLDWASHLQTCLVAWAATGKGEHADTAMTYFLAQLDDLAVLGDGKGGDAAATRDSGFAIRAMGPYTALAYDWLHDHPRMTQAVRARARQRFAAWTTWYLASGYRARSPSTNYHAGYLIAVTFIAIAQNGEAGQAGNALWHLVRDEIWGKDMITAMSPGGILDGGDWAEGWQYAPLSVAEYAIAARAMAQQGVKPDRIKPWLDDLLRRHVHALSPGAGVFVGGDTQAETANLPPNYLTLAATIIGGGSADAQAWALHEIERLKLTSGQWALYGALVESGRLTAKPAPRASWPTAYMARGVGAFFTRSHWGKDAVWAVMQCSKSVDADHVHPNAGNLVISRGPDDLIVDPSPYGTLSSLTGNAPTVESKQLPDNYKPSQAYWSVKTGFAWARQTASGVVAARCDYADQYKFQDRPSDVPAASRDIVVVPWGAGKDATVVVVDRADSGDQARGLHLRFRALAKLGRAGDIARGDRGGSSLSIQRLWSSGGTPETEALKARSCFEEGITRGGCKSARFPVDEWRLVAPGPTMEAAHVIDVGPAGAQPKAATVDRQGKLSVITAERGDGRVVVVVGGSGTVAYRGPARARHIVLDAPAGAAVTTAAAKGGCSVTVAAGGGGTKISGRPAVFALDAACVVVDDPTQQQPLAGPGGPIDAGAAGAAVAEAVPGGGGDGAADPVTEVPTPGDDGSIATPPGTSPRSARSGCCGAQATPGSPVALTGLVLGWCILAGRRGRRRQSQAG